MNFNQAIVYSCSGFLRFGVRLAADRGVAGIKSSPCIQMIADLVRNSGVSLHGNDPIEQNT